MAREWSQQVAAHPAREISRALDGNGPWKAEQRSGSAGPCPACGATTRGDRRGPIGFTEGGGWKCHKCQATGSGLQLAGYVLCGERLERQDHRWESTVWPWAYRAALCQASPPDYAGQAPTRPWKPPAPAEPTTPRRPPAAELAALWRAGVPVTSDAPARDFLVARGFDPAEVASLDLVRALPSADAFDFRRLTSFGERQSPWWPFELGRAAGVYRLAIQAYEADGTPASLHARAVLANDVMRSRGLGHERSDGSWAADKTRWPLGLQAGGLVFADRHGLALLRQQGSVDLEQLDGLDGVLVCEGLTDTLRAAVVVARGHLPFAVLGCASGGFGALGRLRLPRGMVVYAATDPDGQGDRYLETLRTALEGQRVLRLALERDLDETLKGPLGVQRLDDLITAADIAGEDPAEAAARGAELTRELAVKLSTAVIMDRSERLEAWAALLTARNMRPLTLAWLDRHDALEQALEQLAAQPEMATRVKALRAKLKARARQEQTRRDQLRAEEARRAAQVSLGADWADDPLDVYVLEQVLARVQPEHRDRWAAHIRDHGWAQQPYPRGGGEVASAWCEWRSIIRDVVPLGIQMGRYTFYRHTDGELVSYTASDLGRVVNLAALFRSEWSHVRAALGTRVTRDGNSYVDEAQAVKALQSPLGVLCSLHSLNMDGVGDGYHVVDGVVHVVTGDGAWRRQGARWTPCVPPVIGGRLIKSGSSSVIIRGTPRETVTLPDIAQATNQVLDALRGWTFQADGWAQLVLAGWMVALPVMTLMPEDPSWLALRAPTRSGKTKLARFIAQATGWTYAVGQGTAYSAFSSLADTGAACLLDDVEATAKGERARDEILGALRTGRATRGTGSQIPGQQTRCWDLRVPLIHAGINDPSTDQDSNRMLELRLERSKGHADPSAQAAAIATRVQPIVQWGIALHLDAFRAAYARAAQRVAGLGLEPRYLRNLIPAIAVYELLGWQQEIAIILARADAGIAQAVARGETTESELMDMLLDAPMSWDEPDGSRTVRVSKPLRGVIADLLAIELKGSWVPETGSRKALPMNLGACWWNGTTGQVELGLNIPALLKALSAQLGMGQRYNQPRQIRAVLGAHEGFQQHSMNIRLAGIVVRVTVLGLDRSEFV